MQLNTKKKLTAFLSIISNVVLTLLKITAGIISGSISIISEAIHSLSDCLASFITFISVLKSSKPADNDHPYGHGKYEDMSGFIEGILIIFASFYIIFESARKIIIQSPVQTDMNIGIYVMFVAVVVNILVSSLLFKVAKESNSISLYADAQHLRTDVYSSLGVFAGLILIKFTNQILLDPIIAILVAMFIYKTGYKLTSKAFMNLLDHSLPDAEIEKIKNIVAYFGNAKLKENGIKARQTGPSKDIDLILQFNKDTSICECHKICEEIENIICKTYLNCSISIHAEPICYSKECQNYCKKEDETAVLK